MYLLFLQLLTNQCISRFFLNFEIICRRPYLTCREKYDGPKTLNDRGCSSGVMVKAMGLRNRSARVSYSSRANTFTFRANTLGKGMNPLILPAMG